MSTDSSEHQPADAPQRGTRFAQWLVMSIVGLTVLTLAAAHAPSRVKLLGLFAIFFGLIAGWGMGRVADVCSVSRRRLPVVITFFLIAVAQVSVALESRRIWATREWNAFLKTPIGRDIMRMSAQTDAPENFDKLIESQKQTTTFAAYLERRVSPLGDWPPPWPALFLTGEVLFAATAGAWVSHRQMRPSTNVDSPALDADSLQR